MNKPINRIAREDVEQFRFLNAHSGEFNSLDRYQEIATGSAIYPGRGTPFGLMYAALGLAEAGEVQNKVKKAFRDDDVLAFERIRVGSGVGKNAEEATVVRFQEITPERRAAIIKELGGALWYIGAVCNEIGATMSEVAAANLDELCGRTDRGTLGGDGDDR